MDDVLTRKRTVKMNRIMMILSLSLMAVFTVCAQEDTTPVEVNTGVGDFVVVCPVDGMVDRGLGILIERAVRESYEAEALILVVDTPGGLVDVVDCRGVLFSRLESADPERCGGPFGEHGGIGE